jgi:hypothetical protein
MHERIHGDRPMTMEMLMMVVLRRLSECSHETNKNAVQSQLQKISTGPRNPLVQLVDRLHIRFGVVGISRV